MDTKDPNFAQGMAFLAVGIALALVLEPWFIGLAFLAMGAHRLWVVYQASLADKPSSDE